MWFKVPVVDLNTCREKYGVVSVTKSLTEDDSRECDSDSECLLSKDCQYYQEQQDLLKSLTDKTLRANLIKKLKDLICNKKERTICCPKSENKKDEKCGYPQIDSSNVSLLISIF